MRKQKHPGPSSHRIPTAHDRRGLGRDDPVWPCYVEAATRWDEDLVKGWNKGMDVILTLFSAIVTAFLVESYKSLKQDNEDIIASSTIIMVQLLHAIAIGQPPSASNATAFPASTSDFRPTATAVLVNFVWFLSLTLSMMVALLAMLVKQWGEGYRSGQGLTAPYTQARTRQARYDKLKDWRTEDIVLVLPLMMHAALGKLAITVTITTAIYLATTLLPLGVTFCPYNTPLSSERLWNYFWKKLSQYRLIRNSTWVTTSRQEDIIISQDATPDLITARALEWLIGHSQSWETVDKAIEALSNAILEPKTWELLAQPSLINLVTQRFTAIFSGSLDYEVNGFELEDESQVKQAALYGQLLVNLAKHASPPTASTTGASIGSTSYPQGSVTKYFPTENQIMVVERGLSLVSFNQFSDISAAQGIVSISSWYTLTDRAGQTGQKWERMLVRLIEVVTSAYHIGTMAGEPSDLGSLQPLGGQCIFPGNNTTSTRIGPLPAAPTRRLTIIDENLNARGGKGHSRDPTLSTSVSGYVSTNDTTAKLVHEELLNLLRTLVIEISHWRWDISQGPVFRSLLRLFGSNLIHGSGKRELSAALAVFSMLFNNYPEITENEISALRTTEGLIEVSRTHEELGRDSSPKHSNTNYSKKLQEAKRRPRRAQYAANVCIEQHIYLERYSDSLLLLGIGGLLDSFTVMGLTDSASEVIEIVVNGLNEISASTLSEPMSLPHILPLSFDLRTYILDVITRALNPSPFEGPSDGLRDDSKAELLRCISQKKLWTHFGHQLILPVLQLLHSGDNSALQTQCLNGLDEYCETYVLHDNRASIISQESNPWETLFAFNAPHRIIRLIKVSNDEKLRSKALNSFCSITSIMPNSEETAVSPQMIRALKKLSLAGLLDTLSEIVVGKGEHGHDMRVWKHAIQLLPRALNPETDSDYDQICDNLRAFCESHNDTPGFGLIIISLREGMNNHAQKQWFVV
ncbi:hypothetical protein FRC11_001084 [Ceratobasidium sp. 423]|nr:hypothetical protein FRC11_001084 [Ceratobasidium sp. 423]